MSCRRPSGAPIVDATASFTHVCPSDDERVSVSDATSREGDDPELAVVEVRPSVRDRKISSQAGDALNDSPNLRERRTTVGGAQVLHGRPTVCVPENVQCPVGRNGKLWREREGNEARAGRILPLSKPRRPVIGRPCEPKRRPGGPHHINVPEVGTAGVVVTDNPLLVVGRIGRQRRRLAPRLAAVRRAIDVHSVTCDVAGRVRIGHLEGQRLTH